MKQLKFISPSLEAGSGDQAVGSSASPEASLLPSQTDAVSPCTHVAFSQGAHILSVASFSYLPSLPL